MNESNKTNFKINLGIAVRNSGTKLLELLVVRAECTIHIANGPSLGSPPVIPWGWAGYMVRFQPTSHVGADASRGSDGDSPPTRAAS